MVTITLAEFRALRDTIHAATGIWLGDHKQQLVCSRLQRRLEQLGYDTFAQYHEHVTRRDPRGDELRELINRITTNKTEFFREAHHFEYLRTEVLPALKARAASGAPRRLRIWSAACSTGEEPYSLLMLLAEELASLDAWDVRLLASDIDTEVLARAEAARYDARTAIGLTPARLAKHFAGDDGAHVVADALRRRVAFRQINLNGPSWPLKTRFDAIFCRNVAIYFDRPTQDRLWRRFAEHLAPGGHLFVGHAESLHALNDVYAAVGPGIYLLRDGAAPRRSVGPPVMRRSLRPPPPATAARRSLRPAAPTRALTVGDVVASAEPMLLRTVLGSCVAACLHDPAARVGGMNHFLLPDGDDGPLGVSRYGVHAMELLINAVLRAGARRDRLVAKLFGGAAIFSGEVGARNARFAREFLAREGIRVAAECLGGAVGAEVTFHTDSGRAFVRRLPEVATASLAARERGAGATLRARLDAAASVALFTEVP